MDFDHLVKNSWQIVPFALDEKLIQKIVIDFKKLINEPDEIKYKWQVRKKGLLKADHGLFFKSGTRINQITGETEPEDQKCFFHFWSDLIKLFVEHKTPAMYEYMEFLYNCYQLHTKLRIHAETIIEQLDKSFPKYGILKQYEKQSPEARNLLRILYYPKTKKPEQFYQAHPHIDRCFLTTHIWDSKPGLILIDKNKVTPYTTSTDQILNFFGVKAQLQTKGHFTPKPHLVKTKDLTERISIVFFTHISGDEKLVTEIVDTISEHLTQTYKQNHPK